MTSNSNSSVALVLGSGGVNSTSYIGVCKYLEEVGIVPGRIKHVVGCSGGAVVGMLVCCGYKWREMVKVCLDMDAAMRFDCFLGAFDNMGIDSMDGIRDVLEGAVVAKHSKKMTLKELQDATGIRFTCYATNLLDRTLHAFDSQDTPDVPVVHAVCASMCVPFVFAPVIIGNGMFLDGAIVCAMPPNPIGDYSLVVRAKTHGPTSVPLPSTEKPKNALELARSLVNIMVTLSNEASSLSVDDASNERKDIIIPVDDDGIFVVGGSFMSIDEKRIVHLIHKGYVHAKSVLGNDL